MKAVNNDDYLHSLLEASHNAGAELVGVEGRERALVQVSEHVKIELLDLNRVATNDRGELRVQQLVPFQFSEAQALNHNKFIRACLRDMREQKR